MKNVTFVSAEIGRGLEAVYCWDDEFTVPSAAIFFKQEGVCVGENEISTRITIVGKQSQSQEHERQTLKWLQERSSLIVFPFGATKESIVSKQLALPSSGFKFDKKIAAWVWTAEETSILPSKSTDATIAKLLGWTHLKENKEGKLFAIPPSVEIKDGEDEKSIESKLVQFPRWSEEKAQAIALLYDLEEVYSFSHIVKHSETFYFVSISDDESNIVSGAHSEINGAISDAIVRYLVERNNREALKQRVGEAGKSEE